MAESVAVKLGGKIVHLRFTTRAIARLDSELGELYGYGFASAINRMGEGDVRFDILVKALKYGLRHRYTGITDDQIFNLFDEGESAEEATLWDKVIDAYTDARDMRLEEVEDEVTDSEPEGPKSTFDELEEQNESPPE